MRLQHQGVLGRQPLAQARPVERARAHLRAAAAAERRRVQHDLAVAELRVDRQQPGARRVEGRRVVEPVGPRRAQRQHAVERRQQRPRPGLPGALARRHHVVVVAVQEPALRLVEPAQGVGAEPLERARGVPHLDHGRRRPMRRHVDRQVRVVDDDQARRVHEVHAADEAGEVAHLAGEVVGVRLEQQRDIEVGTDGPDRIVEVEQVALERGQSRRRQDDSPTADRQEPHEQDEDPEDERREPVLEEAHERPGRLTGAAPTRAAATGSARAARPSGPPGPCRAPRARRRAAASARRGGGRRGPGPSGRTG